MLSPILDIPLSQFLVMDYKQVLCIVLFGSLGEVEGTGYHGLPINNYYFVMGYGVLGVYFGKSGEPQAAPQRHYMSMDPPSTKTI